MPEIDVFFLAPVISVTAAFACMLFRGGIARLGMARRAARSVVRRVVS